MSFAELTNANYAPKREEVKIKVGDKEVIFFANEISYLQRLHLSSIQSLGGDSYSQLVSYSITDKDGRHSTPDDVRALSDEHQEALFVAAAKVNSVEESKKKAE